jgi:hypothetical protein
MAKTPAKGSKIAPKKLTPAAKGAGKPVAAGKTTAKPVKAPLKKNTRAA